MKRWKQLLLAAFFTGTSLGMGYWLATRPEPLPPCSVDQLVVNTENTCRTVFKGNEEDGIKQLQQLVESSKLEEAWAYLPERLEWIEIGKEEKPETKQGEIYTKEVKFNIPQDLFRNNHSIIIYHFHPRYSLQLEELNVAAKQKKEVSKQKQELGVVTKQKQELNAIVKREQEILIRKTLPSGRDLSKMIVDSRDFYQIHPQGQITFKFRSPYGITEFFLTEKGKEFYKDKGNLAAFLVGQGLRNKVENGYPMNFHEEPFARIEGFCGWMSNNEIQIRFMPYQ